MKKSRFATAAVTLALTAAFSVSSAENADAAQSIRGADPSVIRVGGTYISVQSLNGGIAVRQAPSTDQLAAAPARQVWSDTRGRGEVWAPEITVDGGRYYIYFSAGAGAAHRMFVISSASPAGGYTAETQLALPDDKWAIDGALFTFNGQRWFVWSGWAGDTNVEQNLYVARMSSPTTPTGARYIISQPREGWERVVGNPFINEGPSRSRIPTGNCTSCTPPTAAGATSTASPTCGCVPAATRPTCGTGTSPTAASSARTGPP
jgi:GH43 family beta-xylosidase